MTTSIEKRLGARVRKYRNAAGVTQEALANAIDVTPETVSRLERGATIPSVLTLAQVADALGVELRDLFDFASAKSARADALDALVNYLRGRRTEDIALVHRVAHTIFEGREPRQRSARRGRGRR